MTDSPIWRRWSWRSAGNAGSSFRGLAALERLCIEVRHQARREVHRRLTDGLSADQRKRLDALTQRRRDGTPARPG